MIRVVNNKKLEMTEPEWAMYQKIVQSYTDLTGKGEDLFIDLFDSDDDGVITFLRPPSRRRTSLEVFLFLIALMNQQHLRIMYKKVDEALAELKNKT